MFIEFGMQCGFKTDKRFEQYHTLLNKIFNSDKNKPCIHFKTLHEFSIMFRVAGGEIDFDGGEGPEFLKKARNRPVYTIDLVISEKKWPEKTETELREYVAQGVRDCFALLRDKAVKAGEVKDVAKLDTDFEQGMAQFSTLPLPELPKY
ncbi:Uncharacterised protein [Kingella denitrificans]|uniref:Uncharacterized protein n=1 Tax=Kingella denitrificans ATCC 33394 TaxID=888741 RepID=F0EWK2_9NEIS|nr:hypothetical protein [Kingella denitrificans]EGC18089.1 hypothetical protein HMPREF9098_0238 [Kingella denitrificans ATCC 33394]QQB41050.1 hypothetical protein I6I17_05795 [Kingella denitrificans]STR10991.1 Uncharacterised protein [Kingella denitrificans]